MNNEEVKKILVQELGLGNLSDSEQAAMIEQIGQVLIQAVMLRVLPTLSETDAREFETLVAGQNPAAVFEFLGTKVPNFDQIVVEEIKNFKDFSAKVMAQA